jgi:hypothetical protein
MVETIQRNGLWHTTLVERDLVEQAKLNQEDFEQDFGFFRYKGRPVIVSHIFGEHLVVSMEGREDSDLIQLMDSFSKIVEYNPFCKYDLIFSGNKPALPTYEWDRIDNNSRYQELSQKENILNLTRLP